MLRFGIATISDRVSVHYERNSIPYIVGSSNVAGSPGMEGSEASPSLFSGSVDVYADGRSVHRKHDSVGIVHMTNAVPTVDDVVGIRPANTLKGLGLGLVWRFHHQPFLLDGSSDVMVNNVPAGFHGARYICSAIVEGRLAGLPTVFVSPSLGGSIIASAVSGVTGLVQTAADHVKENIIEPILERVQGE